MWFDHFCAVPSLVEMGHIAEYHLKQTFARWRCPYEAEVVYHVTVVSVVRLFIHYNYNRYYTYNRSRETSECNIVRECVRGQTCITHCYRLCHALQLSQPNCVTKCMKLLILLIILLYVFVTVHVVISHKPPFTHTLDQLHHQPLKLCGLQYILTFIYYDLGYWHKCLVIISMSI